MRTVTYGAACSLDGFIAAKDGGLDWLHFSKDVQDIMAAYWKTIDVILMGRKTWSASVEQGGGGGGFGNIKTYVFSRTLKHIADPKVQLVTTDAAEFVSDLKGKPGKGICVMGGGDLARSLFEAGLMDEVGLNVHPVLLGSGVPFFLDAGRRTDLELTECRTLDGGCVFINYRVRR